MPEHINAEDVSRESNRVKLPFGEPLHVIVVFELAGLTTTRSRNFEVKGFRTNLSSTQHNDRPIPSLTFQFHKSVTMGFADFLSDAGLTSKPLKHCEKMFR